MPSVSELTDLLGRLDRIQRQLSDLRSRLRRGPLIVQTQLNQVQSLTTKLETLRKEHQQLVLDAKEKEKLNSESENAIARRKTQLSEAKSNKEFQALKAQIAIDEESNLELTARALKALEKSEDFVENVTQAEAELEKAKQLYGQRKAEFEKELPHINEDVTRCTAELQAAESELSKDFREVYDRLVHSRGGEDALAVIANQKFCSGCNQMVPINSIALVIQGKPIPCSSCGRLLYVPEGYQFAKG